MPPHVGDVRVVPRDPGIVENATVIENLMFGFDPVTEEKLKQEASAAWALSPAAESEMPPAPRKRLGEECACASRAACGSASQKVSCDRCASRGPHTRAVARTCPSEAAAIGDGENDAELLQYVGLGVAMGNGAAAAKKAAQHVAPSNTEDGFSVAMEELIISQLD